jgi:hypothetical protein
MKRLMHATRGELLRRLGRRVSRHDRLRGFTNRGRLEQYLRGRRLASVCGSTLR